MSKTLHNLWIRLSNRNKIPRCLWFPPKRRLDLDAEEWKRQHDDVSGTLRRAMLTLLGYSFFCLLTLSASDVSLVARDAIIRVPFAGIKVNYAAFLIIGPLVLLGLTTYLHIFVGHWLTLGIREDTLALPFIFNMQHRLANRLADLIFYWLPSFVLVLFAWKALPRPFEAELLIVLAGAVIASLAWLKIRRSPDDQRGVKVLILWLVFALSFSIAALQLKKERRPLFSRSLNLYGADLSNKNLRRANLIRAQLYDADLTGADLTKADLTRANMREADLTRANLREANMREANMREADLEEANLEEANLERANLVAANLERANLVLADLRGAIGLTCEQIKKSRNWALTYRVPGMACGAPIPTGD